MAITHNYTKCPICKEQKRHGGNKALAALHSRMTKELLNSGQIESHVAEPKRALRPDMATWTANGRRVVG